VTDQPEHNPDAAAARQADLEPTQNVNVAGFTELISPGELEQALPMTSRAHRTVVEGRQTIRNILNGSDSRMLVVCGPCSIHDPEAAMDYAVRLAELKEQLADRLYIVMRVYFEKPRTTTGWKGLINDPHLDGSFDISQGLRTARKLLLDINETGLAAGTEFLDPFTPQYIDDLVAWAAIGARTTESQTHRQMASGLSMPVGFKNATNGEVKVALNAMKSAQQPHHFLGVDETGRSCIVSTRGNPWGHLILRGGSGRPNYDPENVADAANHLQQAGLGQALMVDCSHANSDKQHEKQEVVWNNLIQQRVDSAGQTPAIGAMIESNLGAGRQDIPGDLAQMQYGVSVTDACIDWAKTQQLLIEGHKTLSE
jgi:3-deoxy-7-phosphoheptulonate synthase